MLSAEGKYIYEGVTINLHHMCDHNIDLFDYIHRVGFLPWYKVPNSDQLLLNLGTAIPDSALASSMTPRQTKCFLLSLLQDFMR